jgi:transcriptional regulator with XRE-family HTH domain
MKERVKSIIEAKAKSVKHFAELIGIQQTTLNNYILGKRSFGLDTIISIVNSFEDISPKWLLTGEGSMYIADELPPITGTEDMSVIDLHAALARTTAECEELQKENTKLLAQLEFMEEYNMRLQKKYLTLENKLSDREKIKAV